MNKNNLLPVSKEGLAYVGCSLLLFLIFSIFDLEVLELLSFLVIIGFIFIFRNPERVTPFFHENSVVSPVDGTVVAIEELSDSTYAYKVEVNSNYLDVGVLRVPFTSKLKSIVLNKGARLSKNSKLSKKINENAEIIFKDGNGNNVKVTHMLKQSILGIKLDAIKSQKFMQGSRYGVMLNGVTTIYLPQNIRINIAVGDDVSGCETLLGYFS